MAALKQTTYSNEFSSMKIILQILLKYVPLCLIDNMSALVYRMAPDRRQTIIWSKDGPIDRRN